MGSSHIPSSTLIPPDALEAFGHAVARLAAEIAAPLAVRLLQEHAAAPAARPEPLVDVHGLAAALGVSTTTVHRMQKQGCPVEYYGDDPRFDVAAVRAWARARGKASVAPPRKARAVRETPIPGVTLKTRKRRV
ncbi:hypothetical protein [Sorangium atrum]|uniref:Helix-turn-helix domain-containing protein n=1 Tax=Sorangium atrum TaxID=2995308 RepID=A0ABT5C1R2_9BACT|nr:hypothetical protein [Sorangium aterium]MDC0680353.1 hypothetical protein [Sorangium aterium]